MKTKKQEELVIYSFIGGGKLWKESSAIIEPVHPMKVKVNNFQVTSGASSGKVLTSDTEGNATWQIGGGGTSDHSLLSNLSYALAGHTGFSPNTHNHTTSNPLECNTLKINDGALQGKILQCSDGLGNTIWTGISSINHTSLGGLVYPAGHTDFESSTSAENRITTHNLDTTNIHGITNTSVLETTSGAQNKVDTHSALNTGVHDVGASVVESVAGSQSKVDTGISTHTSNENAHHAKTHYHEEDILKPEAVVMESDWLEGEMDGRFILGDNTWIDIPLYMIIHNPTIGEESGQLIAGIKRNNEIIGSICTDDGLTKGFIIINTAEEMPRVMLTSDGLLITDGTEAGKKIEILPDGDIEIFDSTKGLILHSATKVWRVKVDDSGNLLTEEVT